jgi:hypothetical protein
MISIRKLASALCLALCFSHYSNAQEPGVEYTTGNIVLPTVAGSGTTPWVGGVYQDNLTCWSWGNPGYCGPNAIVRPGGSINFSFGTTDLYQSQAIANVLPNSGTGLQVNGYTFSFMAKNGNGWDDGRVDYLNAYVHFKNSNGSVVEYDSYDLNYKFNWTNFNFSRNFTTPYSASTLGNVTYGFVGRDNNGWAGPYGPEIYGVNFSLRYSVDQCVINPLSSVSCTGYAEAFKNYQCSINPLYDSTCPGYAQAYYTQQCSINALYDPTCPGYAQAYYSQQCSINALYDPGCPGYAQAFFNNQCSLNALYNTQCPGYAQARVLKDLQDKQTESTETATTTSSPVPTSSTSTAQASSPTVSLADPTRTETLVTTDVGGVELTTSGQISIPTGQTASTKEAIKESTREETKTESANRESDRKRVDPRALAVAMAAVAATERTALATSEQAIVMSQASIGPNDGTGIALGSGLTLQNNRSQSFNDDKTEDKKDEGKNNTAQKSSGPTDNINLLVTPIQTVPDTNQKAGPSVRRGGAVEGMEGGPDPTTLAKAPMDFNQYLNSQLKDAQFYQSKEIYRGQRTVDNQRLLRGLSGGSDALHQRMIEQQYNISGQ